MKKSRIIFLFAIVICIFNLAGCNKKNAGAAGAKPADAVEALKARGVFVLGLDDSFPPLGYRDDDNNIVGYDIDLAKEVAKRLGVTFKAQPIDWDAKEMELETGKIDCIWNGFTITEDRKNALSMTFAYLDNEQVLVVRQNGAIKTLDDMKGRVVGYQSGSSAQEAIEENSGFKNTLADIITYKENITALNDLKVGGVDGVVMDSVVANYSIAQTGEPFEIVKNSLANEEYGIGFRKKEPELRDEVEKILKDMAADGTVAKISTKWFGKDISVIGK
ncbi:MAG: amino acid ABC transporter substrate-binding protein [Treponema sp.]|nr:amino acid ABC transporter substrate-binding protein [Treponema sp.]